MNLTPDELLKEIAAGEGRSLEFKRGLPRDEKLARTLCAFSNTRGGLLLVGVNDNGSLHGVPRPREVMTRIRKIARELIEPTLQVATTTVRCDELVIVAAQVGVSLKRPHGVRKADETAEVVVRVGASNRIARGATLKALHSSNGAKRSLDDLETRIMEWVESRSFGARRPSGDASPALFSQATNIGVQRARRAFVRLERDGLLVGSGMGAKRVYCRP